MTQYAPLAAIHFDDADIDAFLLQIATALSGTGLRVRGVLQSRGAASGECHCADMDLTTLGSGTTFRISQPLGNAARGCRLNPGALAECSAFLEAELTAGADLLILNRFGKGESEGRGFRDLIGKAVALNIPVLTAVKPTYAASWAAFGEGLACDVPMTQDAVLGWISNMHKLKQAA